MKPNKVTFDETDELLRASYIEYYQAVQYLIKFVGGFVTGKTDYKYADYREFAETVVKLIGNIIDDYVDGDIKLWWGRDEFVDDGPITQRVSDRLRNLRKQINDSLEHQQQDLTVFGELVSFIETTIEKEQ